MEGGEREEAYLLRQNMVLFLFVFRDILKPQKIEGPKVLRRVCDHPLERMVMMGFVPGFSCCNAGPVE